MSGAVASGAAFGQQAGRSLKHGAGGFSAHSAQTKAISNIVALV